jgi:hypothetical protein
MTIRINGELAERLRMIAERRGEDAESLAARLLDAGVAREEVHSAPRTAVIFDSFRPVARPETTTTAATAAPVLTV